MEENTIWAFKRACSHRFGIHQCPQGLGALVSNRVKD